MANVITYGTVDFFFLMLNLPNGSAKWYVDLIEM